MSAPTAAFDVTRKIIVVDDDPTGSQTVHSCPLLTQWEVSDLVSALEDPAPIFFVLSNTRSLGAPEAKRITEDIARNMRAALDACAAKGKTFHAVWVSRSDSTLRGHYPLETDVFQAEVGPFDRTLMIPAFIQGGRVTKDGVHYMKVADGSLMRVSKSEFAHDSVFGYKNDYLPAYVEEKTDGRIKEDQVSVLDLATIRAGQPGPLEGALATLGTHPTVAVDAETQDDLDIVARAIWQAPRKTASKFCCAAAQVSWPAWPNCPATRRPGSLPSTAA